MKKLKSLLLVVSVLFLGLIVFTACNEKSRDEEPQYADTYYEYKNGVKQEGSWIKLEKDKWSDDDGASGKLEEKDGTLYGYSDNDVLFYGTVADGLFRWTFDGAIYYEYYKDGSYVDTSSGTNNNTGGNTDPGAGQPAITRCNVTFNANGGLFNNNSETFNVQTEAGNTISEPTSPTQEGFEFGGWSKTRNGTDRWVFLTEKVSSDVTLYAIWTEILVEHEVRFVLNYADATDVTRSTENGFITYVPTREGYDFNGWYTDSDLNRQWNTSAKVTVDGLVLYAEWVEEKTVEGQLSAPSVSFDQETHTFSWKEVSGANGYFIKATGSGLSEPYETSVSGLSWTFPSSMLPTDTGSYTYTLQFRAKGNGINTYNSSAAQKSWTYKVRVLDDIKNMKFDVMTSIVSWDPVDNADYYCVYRGSEMVAEQTETFFDVSADDVGPRSLTVYAKKDNWQSSYKSFEFDKRRLPAPVVIDVFNNGTCEYTLSWASVSNANQYVIKIGDSEIKTTDINYTFTIEQNSPLWNGETIKLTVQAFDQNSNYLISPECSISIVKKYLVTITKTEGGIISFTQIVNNDTEKTFSRGDEVTCYASSTEDGYTWLGWYDGETKVSEGTSLSYTFTMGTENKTYTAKWSHYTITYNLDGGTNGNNPSYFETFATKIVLEDPSKATSVTTNNEHLGNGNYRVTKETTEYTFRGWYTESTYDNEVTEITYTGDNVVLYAKWSETTSTTTTTESAYSREGNYIYFGEYPQTIKANNVTITDTTNEKGYYLGSDGEYYAKVTASPDEGGYKFSNGASVTSGTVYYFKVEPIKWRILSETNGEALILCEMIIDSQEYYPSFSSSSFSHNGGTGYANNYALSNIRKWLNDTFYNTAFTDLQKAIIQLTTVDNSARSTNPNNNATAFNSGTNIYACANTQDKVFLLSEQEVTNSAYGFNASYSSEDTARRKQTSDYSRATGAYMNTFTDYYGDGFWWLRSPRHSRGDSARGVHNSGYADSVSNVSGTSSGVVPALKIRLS